MNNKFGWRRGIGVAEMMAMIVVVIPTTIFIITILFDYWTVMRLDNQLKLIAHRAISAINNAENTSTTANLLSSVSTEEQTLISSLCPPIKPVVDFKRVGDMPFGQTKIDVLMTYDKLNHLSAKILNSSIASYSYHDQNGSFTLECKGS